MKFIIIILLASMSLTALAQRHGNDRPRHDGSLTLRDGRSILRIDVGDDRDDRDMLRRVRRLEQAVRDLQDQVYQLQVAPPPPPIVVAAPIPRRTVYVCGGQFFTAGYLSARGYTESEARANLNSVCQRSGEGICITGSHNRNIRCETTLE